MAYILVAILGAILGGISGAIIAVICLGLIHLTLETIANF